MRANGKDARGLGTDLDGLRTGALHTSKKLHRSGAYIDVKLATLHVSMLM